MSAHKVSCPSCGAGIEIPPALSRGHCVYCGSEILVDADAKDLKIDRDEELGKLSRLLETAMEAWNVPDVVRYADRVLEIDPECSHAWYCKGVATWNLSSWDADRFEEGKTYLDKALEIDPDNRDAAVTRKRWPLFYAHYLYGLSQQQWNVAYQVWQAECLASFGSMAQRKAAPYVAVVHETLDKALSLLGQIRPGYSRDRWESAILQRKMGFLNRSVTGGRFGKIEPYLRRARELKAKSLIWADVSDLPRLREELAEVEAEIARIEQGGGFIDRGKLGNLGQLRNGYVERIENAEELKDAEGSPHEEAIR